jgi:solute carrier family 25 carnitine/acylcarnitine transporter 20/29
MSETNKLYSLIPGFMQGITRVTISYPFDVMKINMQKMHYNSTFSAFKHIFKNDTFKFYRGASLLYTTIGIERSLQFYFLEKFNKQGKNPLYSSFVISTLNSIYTVPIQFITTNISNNKTNMGTYKYIKYVYQNKINPYKGYFIEMPKNILASTIYYTTYYNIRNYFGENKYFAPYYGAISGISVWLIIFPIDTIRTENITNNKPIINIIKDRIKINGYSSFYLGLSPVLFRTIPSASIGMFVYEYFREIISKN